jgi:hypothetical protein
MIGKEGSEKSKRMKDSLSGEIKDICTMLRILEYLQNGGEQEKFSDSTGVKKMRSNL